MRYSFLRWTWFSTQSDNLFYGLDLYMDSIAHRACDLASSILEAANADRTLAERMAGEKLERMIKSPNGKAFTLAMVDRVFRSEDPNVQASRLREVVKELGIPEFLSSSDRFSLKLGTKVSQFLPGLVMPMVARKMKHDSANVILNADDKVLAQYLRERREQGIRVNINQLGEAVLGEEEAKRRMDLTLRLMGNPLAERVSVKLSSVFSQINLVDWRGTLKSAKDRLRMLFNAALVQEKPLSLDMEEYRDMELTVTAFKEVLDEPKFKKLSVGIVLQAYLPDSWTVQQELTLWAKSRLLQGGSQIRLRIVKGANLAMETVEAELHGWNRAPYETKMETDANFKRMLEFGCRVENAAAVRLGVASHNLFDVALALMLREEFRSQSSVEIEMLEGMANPQARAVKNRAGSLLMYAPIVKDTDFNGALAYLVRRLDENSAPENFLRNIFNLSPQSPEWAQAKADFLKAWEMRERVSAEPRRLSPYRWEKDEFHNQPDTDWAIRANRQALNSALDEYEPEPLKEPGKLMEVINVAYKAQIDWQKLSWKARGEFLLQAARVMQEARFGTVARIVKEGNKNAIEADAEVSEAVDFANYYATYRGVEGVSAKPLGIVAVISPWNFPYAIPCSGIFAALMAGNAVLFKPAPETTAIGWHLVKQLWAAGIPKTLLQFYACGEDKGYELITNSNLSAVALTGSIITAKLFFNWRSTLRLFAETSGKNAMIVTAQADREQAVRDVVKSAFFHGGQKCSAASLLILEEEVYNDPIFRRQLKDAAASLPVGASHEPGSVVTPLIHKPKDELLRAISSVDPGEEWLLKPLPLRNASTMWSPGIKYGVRPGSWFQQTECFGPVLGVICAKNLQEAVEIQNSTMYGLTAGIHSLDKAEIAYWKEHAEAGNLYVNRPITGAMVQRQPFGGWKRSSIGPGAKVGGPNYVGQFCHWTDIPQEPKLDPATSYAESWKDYFSKEYDPTGLRCESNVFRYRPCRGVILRLEEADEWVEQMAMLAAKTCGVPLEISNEVDEPDENFIARIPELAKRMDFLRTVEKPADKIIVAANNTGLSWINEPILANGRIELLRWLREQSISETLHRYGNM